MAPDPAPSAEHSPELPPPAPPAGERVGELDPPDVDPATGQRVTHRAYLGGFRVEVLQGPEG